MSSLKDLASLIMVPSLYKDGRLDTVKPLGNGILHPDSTGNHDGTDGSTPAEGNFTFSRGSNLAATRVDVNGLIEKGRENLLLQSNQFDTTWSLSSGSLTSGQSGYDGSSDAWLLSKSGANGQVNQLVSTSGVNTFSVYAKAGTSNFLRLTPYDDVFFDLSTGVSYEYGATTITSTIESVGGGWYRCSITYNASSTLVRIIVADSSSSSTGTSGSIYIQDAQLEQGLVATDYIETGASTAQAGILEDMPRLDYSGGASCPSLLLEPQRTNGLNHSEYFSGTGFGIVAATATPNATTSPEGVRNATSFIGAASSAEHIIYTTGSSTYNGDTTISIFAKANGYDYFVLGAGAQSQNKPVLFNLADGTKVGNFTGWSNYGAPIDSDIEDYGNGWYRLWVTFAATSGVNTNMFFGSIPTDSVASGANVSTQNGTDGSYIYGAQIEAGSYPTSYIPTYGSSVTRSYDVCKKTNIDSLIAEEGTAFIDVTNGDENEVNAFMTIADSSVYPNHIWIGQNGTTLSLYVKANDSYSVLANNIVSIEGRKKIAVVYTNESIKVFVNGTNEYTTLNKTLPSQLNRVELNAFNTSINTGTARYDQAILFPTALTDSECIALTTL